jgi:hypothetical protein
MNSNQRSQGNNQSSNGGNEKSVSSSRGGIEDKNNLNPAKDQSQQSDMPGGSRQGQQIDQQSTDRTGSQTGSEQQGMPNQRESNDLAGGYPRSPGSGKLAADDKMDDDTGLSNTANRQSAEQDKASRQSQQSNVGRRDDGTPD